MSIVLILSPMSIDAIVERDDEPRVIDGSGPFELILSSDYYTFENDSTVSRICK